MFRHSLVFKILVSYLSIFSILHSTSSVRANDIVPTDDLVGGASVFVFRGSSKKPQEKAGTVRGFRAGGGTVLSSKARITAQIASVRKRKADAAKARAAELARIRAREKNARLKQSNTLTARAETQMASGEIDGAITNFREALKLNAKNADATSGLSEALTAKGIETAGENYNEAAMVYFDEAVKLNPKNEIAFTKIGEIHDANGRNAQAITYFEKALAIDPSITSIYLPLGLAHAEEKNYVEAEAYLSKAEDAGIASSEARLARADIFTKQGRAQEALALLDKVIAAEPSNIAALYQRGAALDKMGQADQAFAAYQKTVQIDPNFGPAWFDIGVAYYNKGDYPNALAAYQNVVRIEPANYVAQANLASTFRQLERYAEANAAYKAAEPGNTKNPDHYSEWGFCLGKTNEWDKAVIRLNTARELSPNAVDNTNLSWAYYNAARLDQKNKDEAAAKEKFELARQYSQTAVEQDPKLDAAYMNLGSTNNALGDFQAAVNALNIALSLRSDWVIAINQLGLGYRGMNNLVAAIDQFKRVTTLDGNNVFGLYNLGEVYHLTGNKKEAKKVQDRLKKIDPVFASRLNDVLSGKIAVDAAKRQIENKVPRIPRFPF